MPFTQSLKGFSAFHSGIVFGLGLMGLNLSQVLAKETHSLYKGLE